MKQQHDTSKDNPFYDNHFFTKEDIKRGTFNIWKKPILWFVPTYAQITECGLVTYKIYKGAYYIMSWYKD